MNCSKNRYNSRRKCDWSKNQNWKPKHINQDQIRSDKHHLLIFGIETSKSDIHHGLYLQWWPKLELKLMLGKSKSIPNSPSVWVWAETDGESKRTQKKKLLVEYDFIIVLKFRRYCIREELAFGVFVVKKWSNEHEQQHIEIRLYSVLQDWVYTYTLRITLSTGFRNADARMRNKYLLLCSTNTSTWMMNVNNFDVSFSFYFFSSDTKCMNSYRTFIDHI